ncbi:MAG: hypothetical protein OJI67_09935, partial [Prosthecobacter sp.]|nr:hypothetical protein [Prosthecobacter sp.]
RDTSIPEENPGIVESLFSQIGIAFRPQIRRWIDGPFDVQDQSKAIHHPIVFGHRMDAPLLQSPAI